MGWGPDSLTSRTPQPARRQTLGRRAVRRPHGRIAAANRERRRSRILKIKLILCAVGLVLGLVVWAAMARTLAPKSNTNLTRFDAIIVLGTPADGDGNPTPHQLARVT